MNHLLERFRDGRIAIADFTQLKQWLESDIDAPRNVIQTLSEIHAGRRRGNTENVPCPRNDRERKRNSLGRRTRRTDRNEWPYLVKEYRKSATRRV